MPPSKRDAGVPEEAGVTEVEPIPSTEIAEKAGKYYYKLFFFSTVIIEKF